LLRACRQVNPRTPVISYRRFAGPRFGGGPGLRDRVSEQKPPRVVREKTSRLSEGRVACALVLDRELGPEEMAAFYRVAASEEPRPQRFSFDERVVRYECDRVDEPRWRLAFEIFLARALREPPRQTRRDSGVRARVGLRRLYLG
jgi:hypothetical protein